MGKLGEIRPIRAMRGRRTELIPSKRKCLQERIIQGSTVGKVLVNGEFINGSFQDRRTTSIGVNLADTGKRKFLCPGRSPDATETSERTATSLQTRNPYCYILTCLYV